MDTNTENGLNTIANQLSVDCIVSNNDSFSLDSAGNLIVKSIQAETLNTDYLSILDKVYPVGSIYISVNATNPSTIFGGTWTKFGQGRTLVGLDTNQTEFNTLNKTGGSKTVTLTESQMPSHSHTGTTSNNGSHTHQTKGYYDLGAGPSTSTNRKAPSRFAISSDPLDTGSIQSAGLHEHTFTTGTKGGSKAHTNIQPYIVVNMWQRTK